MVRTENQEKEGQGFIFQRSLSKPLSLMDRVSLSTPRPPLGFDLFNQKNVRNPNHHYFSKKVLQYAPNLYCTAFGATEFPGKGNSSVLPPFVLQYASHLYRSTSPICIAIRLPFVSQYFWQNLGGCGHGDAPHLRIFRDHLRRLFLWMRLAQSASIFQNPL